MRQLIVNADDFGLTEQVSRGILDAHREGIVTSTTLMANGGAFDAAVSMARREYHLAIGVHLNLTEGVPVSPASNIPTLVDRQGRLHLSPRRLAQGIMTRQVNLAEVETELWHQIWKVLRAGILPTHLDGHKHVHVLPGVSDIVIRLAQEFSIPGIRCPSEAAPKIPTLLRNGNSRIATAKQYLLGRAVSIFARRFREKLVKAGLLSPAHFYGLSQTGFLDTQSIQDILGDVPEGASELMCHPGYLDADLAKTGTRLRVQREVEIRGLTAHQVRKLVADRGIQLINYLYLQFGARAPEREVAAREILFGTTQISRGSLHIGRSAR
jgi:hopanoid biosynthesis associated protein HpnK